MSKELTISTIVPVYQGENYVREALNSILQQSLVPNEIIVVNDGSTDSTSNILREYRNYIVIIEKDKNEGLSKALNDGIERSTSNYLTFLDHDDVWYSDFIERAIKEIRENSNISVLQGQIDLFDRTLSKLKHPRFNICLGSMLIRKDVFEKIGLIDCNFSSAMDFDFYKRLVESDIPINKIYRPVIYYRRHSKNMTNNVELQHKTIFQLIRKGLNH